MANVDADFPARAQPSPRRFRLRPLSSALWASFVVVVHRCARTASLVTAIFFIGLSVSVCFRSPLAMVYHNTAELLIEKVICGASDELIADPKGVKGCVQLLRSFKDSYDEKNTGGVDKWIGFALLLFGFNVLASMTGGCLGRCAKLPQMAFGSVLFVLFSLSVWLNIMVLLAVPNLELVVRSWLDAPMPIDRRLAGDLLSASYGVASADRIPSANGFLNIPVEYAAKEFYYGLIEGLPRIDNESRADTKAAQQSLTLSTQNFICDLEARFHCRGFHDGDCTPDIVSGPCNEDAQRAEKMKREEMSCFCLPCPRSIAYTRGCFPVLVERFVEGVDKAQLSGYLQGATAQSLIGTSLLGISFIAIFFV